MTEHQSLKRKKMIEYYSLKTNKDFKNSKSFWSFYSTSIIIKSDKTNDTGITSVQDNNILITEPSVNKFATFFTLITSNSKKELSD